MKKKASKKQPTPKKGYEFTGWATFNWGHCHRRVHRTRKEAIQSLTHHNGTEYYKWDELKSYMKIVKVKCVVL